MSTFFIWQARHPILERLGEASHVPNDVHITEACAASTHTRNLPARRRAVAELNPTNRVADADVGAGPICS